jgi:tetratricopeptide (TPR) repeat protein
MRSILRITVLAATSAALLLAQATGGAGGTTGGSTGGATGGSTGGPTGGTPPGGVPGAPGGGQRPGQSTDPFGQQNRFPDMQSQMPVFLSGKVMMDDGTPPPEPVTIERVCNGAQPRPEGYTDSKGRFSIQLGNNMNVLPDASVSNSNDVSDITGIGGSRGGGGLPGQRRGFSERDLMGCELRAALPGYRSQVVQLAGRRLLDNPDVGTIILKRLGNVEGVTLSITSMQAPKDAKKAYEKGASALKKEKLDEAERELQKAVSIYPEYASAWQDLGYVYERKEKLDDARDAYEKALKADAKFVKPYMHLAGIYAREQKWEDVVTATDRVLRLNPYDFPGAYFYNAVANLNLQNLDAAEKSAREGIKQDELHRLPKLEHVLGVVLAQKNDLNGASEHMKAYLKFSPNAKDADFVRNQLAELEKLRGEPSAAAAVPQP